MPGREEVGHDFDRCITFNIDRCINTTKSATYLVYTSKTRCHRVLCGVFKGFFHVAFAENALFKSSGTICRGSPPPALPCGSAPMTSRWTVKKTAITSFQREECACLAIAPVIRPTHHSSELTAKLLGFQHCIVTADLALVAHARGTACMLHIAQSRAMCTCGY